MICNVDNCENKAKTAGMCVKHYTRFRRHGTTDVTKQKRRDIVVPEGMRFCNKCEEVKPVGEFNSASLTKGWLASSCKTCHYSEMTGPSKTVRKKSQLKRNGWTMERYIAVMYAQGGLCYICGAGGFENGAARGLVADHDHETEESRMLLCDFCNVGLGRFLDDPELLLAAANYLKQMKGVV